MKCRYCFEALPPTRRTFCSDKCAKANRAFLARKTHLLKQPRAVTDRGCQP